MIAAAFLVVGVVLVAGSVAVGFGPVAFVCGALMLWTGIVKAIVLHIWHTTLSPDRLPDGIQHTGKSGTAVRQES
ncbi:MAG TPA: hypothetical protein VK390_11335 [Propionibacteriaceae bacterium]|nr:hypothetical protein [Propionibacteriaceae bacterium]